MRSLQKNNNRNLAHWRSKWSKWTIYYHRQVTATKCHRIFFVRSISFNSITINDLLGSLKYRRYILKSEISGGGNFTQKCRWVAFGNSNISKKKVSANGLWFEPLANLNNFQSIQLGNFSVNFPEKRRNRPERRLSRNIRSKLFKFANRSCV